MKLNIYFTSIRKHLLATYITFDACFLVSDQCSLQSVKCRKSLEIMVGLELATSWSGVRRFNPSIAALPSNINVEFCFINSFGVCYKILIWKAYNICCVFNIDCLHDHFPTTINFRVCIKILNNAKHKHPMCPQ